MLKVGLIGLGFMGTQHANCYKNIPGVELAALADIRVENAKALAEGTNAVVYSSGEELIEKADVDIIRIPEDLGMQIGPMISPGLFRKYIKPLYQRMLKPVREAGKIIHMHSDGDIRTLVDDIIDGGVDVINLQDCVNGVEWIGGKFRGKTCVDLDIDRQKITRFGTPKDIDDHIRRCVETVGCPEGGLMMIYGLYPDIPMENVRAVMDAMTRYAGFYR